MPEDNTELAMVLLYFCIGAVSLIGIAALAVFFYNLFILKS